MAIFLYFVVLVVLAVAAQRSTGQAGRSDRYAFVPRPEWYFLFLFQTLKFFEGPLEVVGTVVLPTLAILVLFLIPFIDRGKGDPAGATDCGHGRSYFWLASVGER